MMEHKKHLEELNEQTLAKFEEYLKTRPDIGSDAHKKIGIAKNKWQSAWNEFLETLVVLEKLEI